MNAPNKYQRPWGIIKPAVGALSAPGQVITLPSRHRSAAQVAAARIGFHIAVRFHSDNRDYIWVLRT